MDIFGAINDELAAGNRFGFSIDQLCWLIENEIRVTADRRGNPVFLVGFYRVVNAGDQYRVYSVDGAYQGIVGSLKRALAVALERKESC